MQESADEASVDAPLQLLGDVGWVDARRLCDEADSDDGLEVAVLVHVLKDRDRHRIPRVLDHQDSLRRVVISCDQTSGFGFVAGLVVCLTSQNISNRPCPERDSNPHALSDSGF